VTPLPYATLALSQSAFRNPLAWRQGARKHGFDVPPSRRKIGIAFRQRPDCMKMIRQYDDGIDHECMPDACVSKSRSQKIDMIGQEP
jgi:hypothetical protein